ncbi:2-phospho-L-lactate transferase CofD family protein [Jatrophihabitans sp. DSM 44399]|uniref:Putative gluconeogenesis factor n=1 Tax=Jatrophihabitans lederbergiae TaxID=3075547 RepID=A0ABU2J6V5_9ACTN|nr:2-phospho-L-lactate transferase CofD family protein [Jatrophihabitans sp. DSM 44399]MDT0260725.1 2-phospho-L-lactate transferase CofD family protein [Jatrophihabitans sp. DSM 44399]
MGGDPIGSAASDSPAWDSAARDSPAWDSAAGSDSITASDSPVAQSRRLSIVALGGGHGLYASLSALRLLDTDITAVVTVADDGGSSGRIRRELGVLPPGDLRMALAALATGSVPNAVCTGSASEATGSVDEEARQALPWATLLQHRMGGAGALAGHPIGNLLLTGLMELHDDGVTALDALAGLVGARGRVLPMSPRPLDLVAEVASVDPDDPVRLRTIRGQSAIAATSGRVRSVRLIPEDAPACAEAVQAIADADAVILGPGSWFTSVIPHLLVPGLAEALTGTNAKLMTILNLEPQVGETDDFSPEEHLRVLREHCPGLRVDVVIADTDAVTDPLGLRRYTDSCGARLVLASIAAPRPGARHDPGKLSMAIADAVAVRKAESKRTARDDAAPRPATEQPATEQPASEQPASEQSATEQGVC